jgi:hypothetical protein
MAKTVAIRHEKSEITGMNDAHSHATSVPNQALGFLQRLTQITKRRGERLKREREIIKFLCHLLQEMSWIGGLTKNTEKIISGRFLTNY